MDLVDRVAQRPSEAAGRHLGLRVGRARLSPDVRSTLAAAAALATLHAELHKLAAELDEVAASLHEMRVHEHVEAFLDGIGDPVLHRRATEWHRAAATAERASAETARNSAETERQEAARHSRRL
jgi:hypothetical protein